MLVLAYPAQLIKQLSATPTIPAQTSSNPISDTIDPRTLLQANKATFFFRLVGEQLRRGRGCFMLSCRFVGTRT